MEYHKDLHAEGALPVPPGFAMPSRLRAIWKRGSLEAGSVAVHVSMNDYLLHRLVDVARVGLEGLRFRRDWPRTEGAVGLWVASFKCGFRQVSVSVWRSPEDLQLFVRSPAHLRIMREFKNVGALYTNTWTAERCDPALIWHQALDRLNGRIEGVAHH